MAAISESLDAHHITLEAQLEQVLDAAQSADWPAYRAGFAALRAAVLDHMAFEEEELFAELARTPGNAEEVRALREQHERLRRDFDTLGAAAPEHDPEGCMQELEQLGAFIREHHARELRLCYPASDALLAKDPALAQGARAVATRPVPAKGAQPAMDLRGLQPPEPIVRIFKALERAPGEPVRAILPHEPVPLYALLQERGFRCSGQVRPDGGYEVLIEKA